MNKYFFILYNKMTYQRFTVFTQDAVETIFTGTRKRQFKWKLQD